MRYSIDTSSIIEGWHRLYPPDVFPSVWPRLEAMAGNGDLAATEEVLTELGRQADDVHDWARHVPGLFVDIDEHVQSAVRRILTDHPRLVDTRRGRSGADPFVIALAQVNGCTVVAEEGATGRIERPNIPDVCLALGIPCMNLLQMIRAEGWVFR